MKSDVRWEEEDNSYNVAQLQPVFARLKDDVLKVKQVTLLLRHSGGTSSPDNSPEHKKVVEKWIYDKSLLLVPTDQVSDSLDAKQNLVLRLFSTIVYMTDERYIEIKKTLASFIFLNQKNFDVLLRETGSPVQNSQVYLKELELGSQDLGIELVLLAYLFKKNIKLFYLLKQKDDPFLKFQELFLYYDPQPEIQILKLYLKARGVQGISLDIICNEYEYEILYKKMIYHNNLQIQGQSKIAHKRGFSHGAGASPASHHNLMQSQLPDNNLMMQLMSMQQQVPLINQAPLQMNLNQEELQKILIQNQIRLQQQQLLILQQQQQRILQQSIPTQMPSQNMVPPPGLSPPVVKQNQIPHQNVNPALGTMFQMPQPFPIQSSTGNSGSFINQASGPIKAFQSIRPTINPNEPLKAFQNPQPQVMPTQYSQVQQQQVYDSTQDSGEPIVSQESPSEQDIDNFKKNRRTKSHSLDVTSKAFVPTAKIKTSTLGNTSQNTNESAMLQQFEGQSLNQQDQLVYGQNLEDPNNSTEIEFKVNGRLKFFNEGQSYGFIVSDIDNKDLFFHYDDMKKTNLSKQFLKDAKNRFIVRLQFKVMAYYGKYNLSKKAVDIELLKIEPLPFDPSLQPASEPYFDYSNLSTSPFINNISPLLTQQTQSLPNAFNQMNLNTLSFLGQQHSQNQAVNLY